MSKPQKRGKLRNPPRGRQYAYVAIVAVLIAVAGSGVYYYVTTAPPASTATSSSSSSSSSGSVSTSVSSSSTPSTQTTAFINTPCTASTTTSSNDTTGTYALICTNLGLIELQLDPAQAPKTVANFVSLAQSGFYNDLVWHRIVSGFVIQSGDPNTKNGQGDRSSWGTGTSGKTIPLEISPSLHNTAGTIAMASPSGGNASSQFFINLVDNTKSLDGSYAVFGTVINGMSVVQKLAQVSVFTDSTSALYDQPITPSQAYIVSVTIQNTP
jgi:cyclophilin family peptidyl-prolyl cis-trans isomerase